MLYFSNALCRVHLICGAASPLTSAPDDGEYVAEFLTGQDNKDAQYVWLAWARALNNSQDANDDLIVLAEDEDCLDDYIWGINGGPATFSGVDNYYYALWFTAGDFSYD